MTRCADCEGKGNKCDHCGGAEVCGAREECGNYELKAAQLQVAAEFCIAMSGQQQGSVTLQKVELVQANCRT